MCVKVHLSENASLAPALSVGDHSSFKALGGTSAQDFSGGCLSSHLENSKSGVGRQGLPLSSGTSSALLIARVGATALMLGQRRTCWESGGSL